MQMSIKSVDEVKILKFDGKLNTHAFPDAQKKLSGLIEKGEKKILLDFEKLDYISSAGLRVLLIAAKQLKPNGGEIRICGLNGVVKEVFDISGFVTIFNVFDTETEALEGF